MKAHPSIAFNTLSGTAGEVTARATKNGTILSSRAKQPRIYTPAQKAERAILSKVGRSYKNLTQQQMDAWSRFAQQFNAASNPRISSQQGSGAYTLTGFQAYVRHNCNRALLGLPPLTTPPARIIYVPQVIYTYMCVTPELIQFEGIEDPGPTYRLVVSMSRTASAGVTYGGGSCVIISPDFNPDQGIANVTQIYTDRFGITPVVGQKYFVTTYWIERNTGFTGPRPTTSHICMATPPNPQP